MPKSEFNRKDWKHSAFNASNDAWPHTIFIGTQAGCRQAFKDCNVAQGTQIMFGLNKAEYSLASTGIVSGKSKSQLLQRKGALVVR